MKFSHFMASSLGRGVRIVAGLALIIIGIALGGGWWALAVVGLVPLLAGAFDLCLFNPLFHQPFSGRLVRLRQ